MICFGRKLFLRKRRIVVLFLFTVVLGLISLCFNYESVSLPVSNGKWRRFQSNLRALRLAKQKLDLSDNDDGEGKNYGHHKLKQHSIYGGFAFGDNDAKSVFKGHDTKPDRQDQTQYKEELNMETNLARQNEIQPQDINEESNPFKKLAPWQEELIITTAHPTTTHDSEWRLSPLDFTDFTEELPTTNLILRNDVTSPESTKVSNIGQLPKNKDTENTEKTLEHQVSHTEAPQHSHDGPSRHRLQLPSTRQQSDHSIKSKKLRELQTDAHSTLENLPQKRYTTNVPRLQQSKTSQVQLHSQNAPERQKQLGYVRQSQGVPRKAGNMPRTTQSPVVSEEKNSHDAQPNFKSQNSPEIQQTQNTLRRQQSQDASRRQQSQDALRRQQSQDALRRQQSQDASRRQQSQVASRTQQSQDASRRQQSQDASRRQQSQDALRRQQSQDALRRQQSQDDSKRQQSQDTSRRRQSQDASRRQHSQDASRKKHSQDTSRRQQSQDASRRRQSQDASRRQQSQDASRRQQSQDASRRQQSQDTPRREESRNVAKLSRSQNRVPNNQESRDIPIKKQSIINQTQRSTTERSPEEAAAENRCQPKQHVVFLKTHKTASSTVTNILNRFGDKQNLTFAIPDGKLNRFNWPAKFQSRFVDQTLVLKNRKPDILCNHAVYNRRNLEQAMPRDTYYVTILRHPMLNFESTFFFLEFPRICNISGKNNHEKMRNFFRSPGIFLKRYLKKEPAGWLIRNGMASDLGLQSDRQNDEEFVQQYVQRLEKEFDLVLIAENFDESLVMLKRDLCWSLEDVAYFQFLKRHDRTDDMPSDIFNNVLNWNRADVLLYSYFSRKFHERLQREGDDFHEEVEKLRQMNEDLTDRCLSETFHNRAFKTRVQVQNYRVNSNLKDEERRNCCRMVRDEVSYIKYHRVKQDRRLQNKTRWLEHFNRC